MNIMHECVTTYSTTWGQNVKPDLECCMVTHRVHYSIQPSYVGVPAVNGLWPHCCIMITAVPWSLMTTGPECVYGSLDLVWACVFMRCTWIVLKKDAYTNVQNLTYKVHNPIAIGLAVFVHLISVCTHTYIIIAWIAGVLNPFHG